MFSLKSRLECNLLEQKAEIYESKEHDEGFGESSHLHLLSLSLRRSTITVPKSRAGDLCAIYASREGSDESAYLRMFA